MPLPTLLLASLTIMGGQVETMINLIEKEDADAIRQRAAVSPESLRMRAGDGSSLIQQALYRRKPAMARLLVELGVQPDFVDHCALGDFSAVQKALRAGPHQAGAFSEDGFPVLALAVFLGHGDVAALLLRSGAKVNTPSRNALQVSPIYAFA
ncbi:MAG: hypothetical protein HZB13_14420 [Acidobacteria bacterium]|nr:hypothetical protein [Acidobacteriota bacterium]